MTSASAPVRAAAPHWAALDGLRGLAVLLVLIDHAGFEPGRPVGVAGVTVFFVLSGFLITDLIQRTRAAGRWSFRAFFLNRVVRLYPALLVMVSVIGAWWLIAGLPVSRLVEYTGTAVLYLEDFFHAQHNQMLFSHTWSLAVEEQFYLVWPFVLPLLRRRSTAAIVLAALVALSIAGRLVIGVAENSPDFAFGNITTNAYALLFGCGIAVFKPQIRRFRRVTVVVAALLLAVFASGEGIPVPYVVAPIFVAGAATVLVIGVLPGARVLEIRPLRFVGRISYALYLWHWPLLIMTGTLGARRAALPILAASFVIAIGSTVLIEEPLRRRWRERRDLPGLQAGAAPVPR